MYNQKDVPEQVIEYIKDFLRLIDMLLRKSTIQNLWGSLGRTLQLIVKSLLHVYQA